MAIITFSKATPFPSTPFPTAALRECLMTNLSGYKWQCGDQDFGGKTEIGRFQEHMLISGRGFETIVFTELRAVDAVMPGAAMPGMVPPHLWHLNIGTPTTEIQLVADRITVIICATLMAIDKLDSRCQLHPGGNWLTAADLDLVFDNVLGGEPLPLAAVPAGDTGERAARIIDDALQSIIDGGRAPALRKIQSILANDETPETRQMLSDVVAAHGAEAAQGAPGATPAPPRRPGGFGRKGL
jgi:hypothetical protein